MSPHPSAIEPAISLNISIPEDQKDCEPFTKNLLVPVHHGNNEDTEREENFLIVSYFLGGIEVGNRQEFSRCLEFIFMYYINDLL